jgi:hypothetical protein
LSGPLGRNARCSGWRCGGRPTDRRRGAGSHLIYRDEEGSLVIKVRLSTEEGAAVMTALEAEMTAVPGGRDRVGEGRVIHSGRFSGNAVCWLGRRAKTIGVLADRSSGVIAP